MKINIKSKDNRIEFAEVITDIGTRIENITDISFNAGINSIPRATVTVNSMDDVTFELLDKNCDIEIDADDLYGFPTYRIIEHLKKLGYKIKK